MSAERTDLNKLSRSLVDIPQEVIEGELERRQTERMWGLIKQAWLDGWHKGHALNDERLEDLQSTQINQWLEFQNKILSEMQ